MYKLKLKYSYDIRDTDDEISALCQTGKAEAIRLIAVRETGVSRHNGVLIEGPKGRP